MTDPMYIKWGRLEAGLGYEKIEVYFGGIRISPGVKSRFRSHPPLSQTQQLTINIFETQTFFEDIPLFCPKISPVEGFPNRETAK